MLPDLLQIPLRDEGVYDELSIDGITPRQQWAPFLERLQQFTREELERRWAQAERRIRENGVTYNIYEDPDGASRPWRIDLIPLLLPADEWRAIEAGVIQRAELLEHIIQDLYGPQRLLRGGEFPPELLFANPAFLRPLACLEKPPRPYLHLIAIDLARSPDGQWWVVGDRTQAPSGAGYALENRMIVSDVLPELFLNSNVRRLTPFFRAQRDALIKLAGRDDPRIVLLTPGPFNETYFEHSYLARYLGFTLVQGADLTVRDRRVWLKTIQGLDPVDVIIRRVDDWFTDPLELRGDSLLGVSGLVDAVSAGNVQIANALGTGIIETAAIMPFLPGLCRSLLGERPRLPSIATWWCGQEYARKRAVQNLERLVIKPAFPSRAMEPVFGAELSSAEKQKLIAQIGRRPFDYVAQERIILSTAPVWDRGHIHSRSLMLRTYVLNTGSEWRVLPGGLVRVAADDGNIVSMQRGGYSKDAWVIWDSPVGTTLSLEQARSAPVELRRATTDLPSRIADNLFWLGRYAERSENIARLLRTLVTRVRRSNATELNCLVRLHRCFDTKNSELPAQKTPSAADLEAELLSLMADENRPDSLMSNLKEVKRIGGTLRDRLSTDMTRLIGQVTDSIAIEPYMLFVEQSALLTGCLELLSAFSGLERENATRGAGWFFLTLGRRLERAMYSTRLLGEIASPLVPEDWPLLEYLLEVADSTITYRTRYFTDLQPVPVLDVLMIDETNPRSLDFQLSHVADLYGKLPRHTDDEARVIQSAVARLRSFDLRQIEYPLPGSEPSARGNEERHRLRRFLQDLEKLLPSWSDNLSNLYFSHARTLPITIGE